MNKIESFILAEKLAGNIFNEIAGNQHIRLSNDFSYLIARNAYIVSNTHIHIGIIKEYAPYAWKVFAGFKFAVREKSLNQSGFRFEGNEDERFYILTNLNELLSKIEQIHDKMNNY